jgi:hypothetical protein
VDGLSRLDLTSEHGDGELLQSLPAELAIELLDLQLSRESEGALKLLERVLVAPCLFV